MRRPNLLVLLLVSVTSLHGAVTWPLSSHSSGRYLVDAAGTPFQIRGDAGWGLVTCLSTNDAFAYLTNRAQKGFNTVIVRMTDVLFQGPGYAGAATPPDNFYDIAPFSTPNDFSTANDEYFATVDVIFQKAKDLGIAILASPLYFGYGGPGTSQGWYDEVISGGTNKVNQYGQFLGSRYQSFGNVIWVMGGDSEPYSATNHTQHLIAGIRSVVTDQLVTGHSGREVSGYTGYGFSGFLTLNSAYVLPPTVASVVATEYVRSPTMPVFLIEDWYENEHSMTSKQLRSEAWWAILAGGCGHVFGNNPIWFFGWGYDLESTGSVHAGKRHDLFSGISWQKLEPDSDNSFFKSGYGIDGTWDFGNAAVASDGTLAVVYLYRTNAITLNLSEMSGSTTVRWYDPTDGSFATATGSPFSSSGDISIGRNSLNSAGDNDWVLLLESSRVARATSLKVGAIIFK